MVKSRIFDKRMWPRVIRVCLFILLIGLITLHIPTISEAKNHPSLLFSDHDLVGINDRRTSVPVVKDAFDRMMNQSWYSGVPQDVKEEAWARQLVELGFVGYVTQDQQKINQAKSILMSKVSGSNQYRFEVFNENPRKYYYGQFCTALVVGYDLVQPSLSSSEISQAQQFLEEWGQGLYSYYKNMSGSSGHNFHTSSVACLGLIGLALEDEVSSASTWISFVEREFQSNFVNMAYNPGGDYTEGYVYQQYGLSSAILYLDALRRNKSKDLIKNSNLSQLWNFYLSAYGSDGSFPRFGDNSASPFVLGTDLYALQNSNDSTRKSVYLWIWQKLRGNNADQRSFGNDLRYIFREFDHLGIVLYYPKLDASPPLESTISPSQLLPSVSTGTTQGFTDHPGGMVVLRSSWPTTADSTSLWLNNRWRWQNHQHYDPNAFSLEGYGVTLISNLNNKSYDDPVWGKWSQQNTVRINPTQQGGDAPLSSFSSGLSSSLGTFPTFIQTSIADVVVSESRYSHANLHLHGLPNGRFSLATTQNITPIQKATRSVILVKEFLDKPFYLMVDDFAKSGASEYWWQIHIPKSATSLDGVGSISDPLKYVVGRAKLQLVFLNQPQPKFRMEDNVVNRDDRPATLSVASSELQLITALFPNFSDEQDAEFNKLQSDPDVYEIRLGDGVAQVIFNPVGVDIVYKNLATNAKVVVGKDWTTDERKLLFFDANYAKFGDENYFSNTNRVIQVVEDGSSLGGSCQVSPDFNLDGLVNLKDISIMIGQIKSGINNDDFDLNCDAQIDLGDLRNLFTRINW